jgi:hypothetical protein
MIEDLNNKKILGLHIAVIAFYHPVYTSIHSLLKNQNGKKIELVAICTSYLIVYLCPF